MSALELVKKNYKGTNIECSNAKGIRLEEVKDMLDCNCVDTDCSIETYD